MKMKKFIAVVSMVGMLAAAMTGCGSGSDDAKDADKGGDAKYAGDWDSANDITVVSREDGSGTRGAFIELFGIQEEVDGEKVDMTTTEAQITNNTSVMMTTVEGNEYAIGYISLGSLDEDAVKALKIDGAEATAENIENGSYKVSRPFNVAVKKDLDNEAAKDFMSFIMSTEGQKVVEEAGYIPVSDVQAYAGTKPEGSVVVGGSSSVAPVMEKLVEAYKKVNPNEKFMQGVFFVAACASVLAVALICIFLFANGIPAIKEIGFVKFITGEMWRPSNELFGIFPMIIGSLYVTAGAVIIGVPIGILTSVFMAMYCPKKIYRPLKAATELLAGIPSVVYGFFGLVVVVPIIRDFGRALKDAGLIKNAGDGNSILTTSLILAMMILPTIIGTTESAMRAVPAHYYEGALALGATKERSIFRVIIPAAKSGVIAGIVLGIGRAVGETMAVIMVAGNQPRLVGNLFKGIRTLTGNIVMEMGYATGLHREALIATGVVLFVFILIINFSVALLKRRTDHE